MNVRRLIGLALGAVMAVGGCAAAPAPNPGDPTARGMTRSLTGPLILPSPSQIFGDALQSP